MRWIQKVFKFLLPGNVFKKVEEESKKWVFECEECGYSCSYWEAGGLRALASKKKWMFGRCPNCQKFIFFKVTKKE